MSSQAPLLPVQGSIVGEDAYSSHTTWRTRTAQFLESKALHKSVIALITIDTICVLTDLSYTFLFDTNCNPTEEDPAFLQVLSHLSLIITTFLVLEIPLTWWAIGWRYYNPFGQVTHAGLHLLDAILIVTTFILEVALKGRERELAALLIILRFWRLVKLVGGITVGAGQIGEISAEELEDTRRELERVKKDLQAVQDENMTLKHRLTEFEQSLVTF